MYSSVLGDFVITQLDENKQLHRYDTKGNTYTQQQVDSLLSFSLCAPAYGGRTFP